MHLKSYILTVLTLFSLHAANVHALELLYGGAVYGPATSNKPDQFDPDSNLYAFFGIQTDNYITYEIGFSNFSFNTFEGIKRQTPATMLMGSVLGHLPVSDSSLFFRVSFSLYQYYDDNDEVHDVFNPSFGLGLDLGITPKISLRIEWQRYTGLEYKQYEADIETWRTGLFFYF